MSVVVEYPMTLRVVDEVMKELQLDKSTSDLVKLSLSSMVDCLKSMAVKLKEVDVHIEDRVTAEDFAKIVNEKVGLEDMPGIMSRVVTDAMMKFDKKMKNRVEKVIEARLEKSFSSFEKLIDDKLESRIKRLTTEIAQTELSGSKIIKRKSRPPSAPKQGQRMIKTTENSTDRSKRAALTSVKKRNSTVSHESLSKMLERKGESVGPNTKSQDSEIQIEGLATMLSEFAQSKIDNLGTKVDILGGVVSIANHKDLIIAHDFVKIQEKLSNLEKFNNLLIETGQVTIEGMEKNDQLTVKKCDELASRIEALSASVSSAAEAVTDCRTDLKKLENSVLKIDQSIKAREGSKNSQHDLLTTVKEIKSMVELIKRNNEQYKNHVDQRLINTETSIDKKIQSLTLDRWKTTEKLREEFTTLVATSSTQSQEESDAKMRLIADDIASMATRIENILSEQEDLCRESSNLLTSLCMKEKMADENFESISQRLDILEAVKDETKDQDSENVNREDLNSYYSDLKRKIDQKVEVEEVQTVLNSMQKKLELALSKHYHMLLSRIEAIEPELGGGEPNRSFINNISAGGDESSADNVAFGNPTFDLDRRKRLSSRDRSHMDSSRKQLIDQLIIVKDDLKAKIDVNDFKSFAAAVRGSLEDISARIDNKIEIADIENMLLKKADIEQVEEVIDAIEGELQKKDAALEESTNQRLESVEQIVSRIQNSYRIGIWHWSSGDIGLRGDVLPSNNQINTLGNSCSWDSANPRIKLTLSGVYKITVFIRFLSSSEETNFSLCLDDETAICEESTSGQQLTLEVIRQFDSEKTISMFYEKKVPSNGVLIIQKL